LEVGDGSRVAAQTGLTKSIPGGITVAGTPAIDSRLWRRMSAAMARLPELLHRVRKLEDALGLKARSRQSP
jgi:UDP-3-O-[3-hydroxymyristoyl] glucosamine N-acyltransferase